MTRGMKKAAVRMIIYAIITLVSFAIGARRANIGLLVVIPITSMFLYILNLDSLERLVEKREEKRSRYCPLMKED